MDIEQEVIRIIKQENVKYTSEQILEKVRERLSCSDGIVLVELRGGKDITVHYSTSVSLAVYALVIAKQLLVDKKLSTMEITENETGEEAIDG